jgi:hypothetical protein
MTPTSASWTGTITAQAERLALCTFTTGAQVRTNGDAYYLNVTGGDLEILNSGRAPFLLEHRYWFDDLPGNVQEAWIEDGKALAVVRLADMPNSNIVWTLLQQDFPLGCSFGFSIGECRPVDAGGPGFIVDSWAATEVSACVRGADKNAMIVPRPIAELAELREQKRAERLERERAERLAGLRSAEWRAWAMDGAADGLAQHLGVPSDLIRLPLLAEVEKRLGALEAGL